MKRLKFQKTSSIQQEGERVTRMKQDQRTQGWRERAQQCWAMERMEFRKDGLKRMKFQKEDGRRRRKNQEEKGPVLGDEDWQGGRGRTGFFPLQGVSPTVRPTIFII